MLNIEEHVKEHRKYAINPYQLYLWPGINKPQPFFDYFVPNQMWRMKSFAEQELIRKCLPSEMILELEEIGSSTIKNIKSRFNIEFILMVDSLEEAKKYLHNFEDIGYKIIDIIDDYKCIGLCRDKINVIFLYDKNYKGIWKYTKDFRNYLNTNPELAKEYERLKIRKSKLHKKSHRLYIHSKESFILKILRIIYPDRIFKRANYQIPENQPINFNDYYGKTLNYRRAS